VPFFTWASWWFCRLSLKQSFDHALGFLHFYSAAYVCNMAEFSTPKHELITALELAKFSYNKLPTEGIVYYGANAYTCSE
jgi:hypothetical protein